MKKEELTALGMTDEQAEKVLEMHGKEQNEAASKLSEAENKLAAAEKNAKELTEKVKAFDGVDLEALRKSAADWETKYNTDIAKAKLDSAVELALTKAGAKDVGLARHLIDTSILKLDGDKVVGLAEQLEKAKTDKAFLFGRNTALFIRKLYFLLSLIAPYLVVIAVHKSSCTVDKIVVALCFRYLRIYAANIIFVPFFSVKMFGYVFCYVLDERPLMAHFTLNILSFNEIIAVIALNI